MLRRLGWFLGVVGSMNFALFIIEEGLQVLMFSSWAGKHLSTETRQIIVELYAASNALLDVLTRTLGIFIPPMYLAYRGYVEAGWVWVRAQVEAYGLLPPKASLWWVPELGLSLGILLAAAVAVWILAGRLPKGRSGQLKELLRR